MHFLSIFQNGADVFEQIQNADPPLVSGSGTGTTYLTSVRTNKLPGSCINDVQMTTAERSAKRIRLDKRESKRSNHALDEKTKQIADPLSFGIVESPHASHHSLHQQSVGTRHEEDEEMITIDADVVKHEIPDGDFPWDGLTSDDEDTVSEDANDGNRLMDGAGYSYGDQDEPMLEPGLTKQMWESVNVLTVAISTNPKPQ